MDAGWQVYRRGPRSWTVAIGFALLVVTVFFFRAQHIPPAYRVIFLLPVAGVLALGAKLIMAWVLRRLFLVELSLLPEYAALLLLPLLAFLVGVPVLLAGPLLVGLVLALVALLRKRIAAFYVFAVGVALLGLVLGAARLLTLEQRAYFFLAHTAAGHGSKKLPEARIVFSADERLLRLYFADGDVLVVPVSPGLSLHTSADLEFSAESLPSGRPLAALSASAVDSLATPCVMFSLISPSAMQTPGDFRSAVMFSLGHRRSEGLLENPNYEGVTELVPPKSLLTLRGISFSYNRSADGQPMRERVYVLTTPLGRQVLIGLRVAVTAGLDLPPDIQGLLGSMRFEKAPSGKLPGT